LLERTRELEAIDELIARGHGLVLIEGRPGYGKTALLADAGRRADAAGAGVLHEAGAELERGLELELVARMLGERPAGNADEAVAVAYDRLSARGATVLVVDDLQWADAASLRFLDFVVRRGKHAVVAARAMPGEPDALLLRLRQAADRVLPLAPLSDEAATMVAGTREEALRCAGNPLLLTGDGERAARWVQLRLDRLPDRCAEVAAAVAVLTPEYATTGRTAALTKLPPRAVSDAADALVAAAFLEPGDPLTFTEPALADALVSTLPAGRRGALALDAAKLLLADAAPASVVGDLLLGAPRLGDEQVVQLLGDAAAAAAQHGDHAKRAAYLARALEEPAPAADRAALTVALAEAEAMAGSLGSLDRFADALQIAHGSPARAEALAALAWRLYQAGRPSDARRAFERALGEPNASEALSGEAAIAARVLGAFDGTWTVEQMRDFALRAREDDAPAGKEAMIAAVAAVFADVDAGLAQRAALSALGAISPDGGGLDVLIGSCAMSALIWSDALDAVDPVLAAVIAAAEAEADPHVLAYLRWGRSWSRYWRGDIRSAANDVLSSIELWLGDWNAQLPSGAWWAARCLVELGQADEAAVVLDQATRPTPLPDLLQDAYLAAGRLHVAAATGRWKEARRHIAVIEGSGSPWFNAAAVTEWQPDAVHALARGGERDRAVELAHAHLEAARAFGAPRTLGAALRSLALVEGGDRGLELLSEAVSLLEDSPSRLELIRALVDQGALLRSLGKRSHARAALKRAIELAADTTADALRERARAELAMTGGAPGGERLTGPDALTPSERRVVELAAAGRSNPDIAAELFVSRKTVEFHLSNAFRKLAVGSRDELLDALGRR
jgi:DNA-binding CsgD family transcriptional regulator